ncbi:MAG: rod shape-determining protein MreC [Alphaproteobacteria bacterium]|nr:rod shape-determining protein MreC [Alphaproteobacteria bacterium]
MARRGRLAGYSVSVALRRFSPAILLGFSAILLLFSLQKPVSSSAMRVSIMNMVAPVAFAISRPMQVVSDWVNDISGLANMKAENARLVAENKKLRAWYEKALLLQTKNKNLEGLLKVLPAVEHTQLTARVMAENNGLYIRALMLDAGAEKNIQAGQAVMGEEGLLGRILNAGINNSEIILLSDISSRIPAVVEDTTIQAVAAGTNGETLSLAHLPTNTVIEEGARLLTSGRGGMLPEGLLIGTVHKQGDNYIVKTAAHPDQAAYVTVLQPVIAPAPAAIATPASSN